MIFAKTNGIFLKYSKNGLSEKTQYFCGSIFPYSSFCQKDICISTDCWKAGCQWVKSYIYDGYLASIRQCLCAICCQLLWNIPRGIEMVFVCTVPAREGRSCEYFGGYKTINRIPLHLPLPLYTCTYIWKVGLPRHSEHDEV